MRGVRVSRARARAFGTALALAASLVLGASACLEPSPCEDDTPDRRTTIHEAEKRGRGEELFATHCSVCHGLDGAADGPAADYLFPPPRDFGHGRFLLASTENGVPSDEDLAATLRRGMPGSAMPAWSWLPDEDLLVLADHVRELAIEGLAERLGAEEYEHGASLSLDEARALARERLTPGEPLAPLPEVAVDEATLARGRGLYERSCASCHAADGTGHREPRWNEDGSVNWARDLTAGYLKGGASAEEIGWRIRTGLPGTAMPPTGLAPDNASALVAYVKSLIPEEAESAHVQTRESLTVRRVDALPAGPDDPAWDASAVVELVLAPLRWHTESIERVTLAALHDGERIAFRLSWHDATNERHVFSDVALADGAALQFSTAAAPPLFGMGSVGHPTNLWHWRSIRLADVAGALDLVRPVPHVRDDTRPGAVGLDAPLYRRLEGVPPVSTSAESRAGRGIETADEAEAAPSAVDVDAGWTGDRWTVTFTRALSPAVEDDVAFRPGATLQLACAVWNSAAGDVGPQKSISIWHELVLE